MTRFLVSKVFSANFANCVLNLIVNSFNNFWLVLGLLYLGMFYFFCNLAMSTLWLNCVIIVDQFFRLYYFFDPICFRFNVHCF